jgi:hypothetical protein
MDRDVRNAIDEAMIGAAAIGFCLARTLTETDPDFAHRLDPICKDTYAFLRSRGEVRAADIVFMFGAAIGNPDLFKIKQAGPNETHDRCNVFDFEAARRSHSHGGQ